MSLGHKLINVAKACAFAPNDAQNDFQKYSYTSAASVLAKVNSALTDNGIYISTKSELVNFQIITNAKGNAEKHAVVKVSITLCDADNPKDIVTFEGLGGGQDQGDKAVMKATTAALKYAYIGGLNIALSDDPEATAPNKTAPPRKAAHGSSRPQYEDDSDTPFDDELICAECGAEISRKVFDYSQKKFGRSLCFNCQKHA